jgi:hypothetical protein
VLWTTPLTSFWYNRAFRTPSELKSCYLIPFTGATMPHHHLAQINIGRLLAPLDDPSVAEFVANLAPINVLADRSPGFVWRFQTPEGNATNVRPYEDDRIIINFSVWESLEALNGFVYQSAHAAIMRKRRQWFEKMSGLYLALWWVPAGHIPTWEEAKARLDYLQRHGETPYAFTFRRTFAPEGNSPQFNASSNGEPCPAL